jgi:hypothetical protein
MWKEKERTSGGVILWELEMIQGKQISGTSEKRKWLALNGYKQLEY